MMKNFFSVVVMAMLLCFWHTPAEAQRNFTITQAPLAANALYTMGSTQNITYTITNTNTNPNTAERIYQMRFRLNGCGNPCRATVFAASRGSAPNWSIVAGSTTTSVTFQANTWNDAIAKAGNGPTTSVTFTLNIIMGSRSADATETLRDARAYNYDAGTPPSYQGRATKSTQGSWKLNSLSIALQTTDCAGTPINSVIAGNNFCLVMTVQNFSSAAQNGIVSNPTPPAGANINKTGTVTQTYQAPTIYNPNPLNLAAGAATGYIGGIGTITFTYKTANADNGTIQFVNLNAQRIATVTSPPANSNVLTVTRINIGITVVGPLAASPTCVFSGDTMTTRMTVTNNSAALLTNVTPTIQRIVTGSANIGAFTAPVPAPPVQINAGNSVTFTWQAPVTATIDLNPKSTFGVTGYVTYSAGNIQSIVQASNTEDVDGYIVSLTPATSEASSANEELIWTVTNHGCANVQSVTISNSIPAGWTWAGADSYSTVGNNDLETWTTGGAVSLPVTFTAPTPADQLPYLTTESGNYSLVFLTTPTPAVTPTVYNFNITITDANVPPIIKILPTALTVNAFDSSPGGPNAAGTGVWREIIQ